MNEILRAIEAEQMRNDLPNFRIGDTVKLHVKIKEGNRERIQMFEGTVIKRQNGGLRETFTDHILVSRDHPFTGRSGRMLYRCDHGKGE